MKTNLSSCCNAEVETYYDDNDCLVNICPTCRKKCDLASPEVIEKKYSKDLIILHTYIKEAYPSGEINKRLDEILSTQEKDLREKIEAISLVPTEEEIENVERLDNNYSNFSYGHSLMKEKILELINKNNK